LGPGVVGLEALVEGSDGYPANGEALCAFKKVSTLNVAVYIFVKEVEKLLGKVACFFAFHKV
jgi:hypothetical protein